MAIQSPLYTPEQAAAWKVEKALLERTISEAETKLKAINLFLEGAALMNGGLPAQAAATTKEPRLPGIPDDSGSTFMGTLERLANAAAAPISRKAAKTELIKAGFDKKQCGNYFYSVISRLKEANRITVMENGDLWRKSA